MHDWWDMEREAGRTGEDTRSGRGMREVGEDKEDVVSDVYRGKGKAVRELEGDDEVMYVCE